MDRKSIPPLTSLRFFAALLVVIFHYDIGKNLSFFIGISKFGYEAVTFFFVLSGFILAYAHLDLNRPGHLNLGPAAFMVHRIARIVPAYFIALALAAPFFVGGFIIHHQIASSLFVTGVLLVPTLLQAWLPPAATLWNIPAWSLSVEMFLYISFIPFVKTILGRAAPIKLLIAAFTLICVVASIRSFLGDHRQASDAVWRHNFFDYFPLWHLPQFIFGVILGRLFASGARFSPSTHEWTLLVSMLAIGTTIHYHSAIPMLSSNVILAPVFGALIFGAAGAVGPFSRILSTRSLVVLGDASYALYIIHVPLWMWWHHVTVVKLRVNFPPFFDFLCYLLIVITTSVLVYSFLERPARRFLLSQAQKVL